MTKKDLPTQSSVSGVATNANIKTKSSVGTTFATSSVQTNAMIISGSRTDTLTIQLNPDRASRREANILANQFKPSKTSR
jgi:hypothetical protein